MYLVFCWFQMDMDLFNALGVAPHVGCFESFCFKVLKTANKNFQTNDIFSDLGLRREAKNLA